MLERLFNLLDGHLLRAFGWGFDVISLENNSVGPAPKLVGRVVALVENEVVVANFEDVGGVVLLRVPRVLLLNIHL